MNAEEITTRLDAISAAIFEKTGRLSWYGPELAIRDNACRVNLYDNSASNDALGIAKGDTPEAALDDADRIIAALPDISTAKLRNHMARVAACIDKAHADGIADEYVTPLRVTVQAMSDNLLAAPKVLTSTTPTGD